MNKIATFHSPRDRQRSVQYEIIVRVDQVTALMLPEGDYPSILVDGSWVKIDSAEIAQAKSLLVGE